MYVHTCTLPISNCTDENGGLSGGIYILDGSNILLHDNVIHDMKWGSFYSTDAGSYSNIQMYNETVYHVDHGFIVALGGPNITVATVLIHNNTSYDYQNWDDAGNGNHHDGLHTWSYNSGDALNGLQVYANYFHGDPGVGFNAWLYEEGVALNAAYFNNKMVDQAGDASAGCGYVCLGDSGGVAMKVLNNTIIGFSTGNGTGINTYSSGDTIENNTLSTMYKLTSPEGNTPAAWDYNNYFNGGGCAWDCGTSFPAWQGGGFDAHGSNGNPNLNGSYQPQASSALLIQQGCNLTNLSIAPLDSDFVGNPRPNASGCQTQGTFERLGRGRVSIHGRHADGRHADVRARLRHVQQHAIRDARDHHGRSGDLLHHGRIDPHGNGERLRGRHDADVFIARQRGGERDD